MEDWLARTKLLIGEETVEKLKNKTVAIFGCGGVGSYAIEGIVRAGIGKIVIVDHDIIDITNLNRQLMTDTTVIGKAKVEAEKERVLKINPELHIEIFQEFYDETKKDTLILNQYDYIIDAIDSVTAKLSLIEEARKKNIPIISAMGTGNKLNPTMIEITDISKTEVCPLAKVIRKELRNRGIHHLKVVYSKEQPKKAVTIENNHTTASISFVPSAAGLIIASEVIKDLIENQ